MKCFENRVTQSMKIRGRSNVVVFPNCGKRRYMDCQHAVSVSPEKPSTVFEGRVARASGERASGFATRASNFVLTLPADFRAKERLVAV